MVSGWRFILGTPTERYNLPSPPSGCLRFFSPLSRNTFASTLQAAELKPRSDKLRGVWQAADGQTRLFTWEDAAEPQTCLQLPSGEAELQEKEQRLPSHRSDHHRTSCSSHIRGQACVPSINVD